MAIELRASGDMDRQPSARKVPEWFDRLCGRMDIKSTETNESRITLEYDNVDVTIRAEELMPLLKVRVEWNKRKKMYTRSWAHQCSVTLHGDDALWAFDLAEPDMVADAVTQFCQKHNAQIAAPGVFIRSGDYLNIPCPGSGMDTDPNLSLVLTPEIREAIKKLLRL